MFNQGITQHDIFKDYFPPHSKSPHTVEILDNYSEPAVHSQPLNSIQRLKAQGNIDVEGFTDRLKALLDEAWEDDWGEFTWESPTDNDPENAMMPVISFDVVSRAPSKGKAGVKARPTEVILDPDNEDYTLILHRQWFDCTVEFLIFHRTNREANALMSRFEAFLDAYKGFFKEQGVSEMIFQGEFDSRLSRKYKDGMPSSCLHYFIVFERILVERIRTTKELRTKITQVSRSSSL